MTNFSDATELRRYALEFDKPYWFIPYKLFAIAQRHTNAGEHCAQLAHMGNFELNMFLLIVAEAVSM